MNFGAWNRVPIVVILNSTETTWDRNLWPVSYQIYFQQIYSFSWTLFWEFVLTKYYFLIVIATWLSI